MNRHGMILVVGLALLGAGCSEHGDHGEGDEHAGHSAGNAGATGSLSSELATPTLTELMPMGGALHVMWTNNSSGCEVIEGERRTPTEDYKVVFTVPGEADNKHDNTASADTDYTYRLRCKKGETFSPYSNELSRNPMK